MTVHDEPKEKPSLGRAHPTAARHAWSVEVFERFWGNPDPALVPAALTRWCGRVLGWPRRARPRQAASTACIAALVAAVPDLYITVGEHASSGEFTFIRW
ncbi:MAG: hypothetical protein JO262_04900 [Solirubrobacterales bacterium]|nr:hypothetical protein [Solirubrobacterales bacterium]